MLASFFPSEGKESELTFGKVKSLSKVMESVTEPGPEAGRPPPGPRLCAQVERGLGTYDSEREGIKEGDHEERAREGKFCAGARSFP